MVAYVGTGTAGATFLMGIYALDANNMPANNLYQSSAQSAASTGIKTATLSLTLTAGTYALAYWSGTANTMSVVNTTGLTNSMGFHFTGTQFFSTAAVQYSRTSLSNLPDLTGQSPTTWLTTATFPFLGIR
jgi:hypothetical protein